MLLLRKKLTNFHFWSFYRFQILKFSNLISTKRLQKVCPKMYTVFDTLMFCVKRCISFSSFKFLTILKSHVFYFPEKGAEKRAGFLCSSNAVGEFCDFASMFDLLVISNVIRRTKWHCKLNFKEKLIYN